MTETRFMNGDSLRISDAKQSRSFFDWRVCVALTAYNDGEAIAQAVKEFVSQRNVVEVIVVDNNSSDKTTQQAENAGARVVHETKQGYGFACIRGLKEALLCDDADVVVLAEGDMTFSGKDIWKLLPFLDDADMVVGSRMHMALVEPDSQNDWFLVWGNLFLAKILQLKFFNSKFFGRARFTDVGCTMRGIRKNALCRIIEEFKVGGYHFSPHMTMVAIENGLSVVEVPLTFRKRVGMSKGAGGNRVRAIKIGLAMLFHMITS